MNIIVLFYNSTYHVLNTIKILIITHNKGFLISALRVLDFLNQTKINISCPTNQLNVHNRHAYFNGIYNINF